MVDGTWMRAKASFGVKTVPHPCACVCVCASKVAAGTVRQCQAVARSAALLIAPPSYTGEQSAAASVDGLSTNTLKRLLSPAGLRSSVRIASARRAGARRATGCVAL